MPPQVISAFQARLRQTAQRSINRVRGQADLGTLKKRGLRVGERAYFAPGTYIDSGFCWLITIGDDVTFAPQAMVLAHDASTRREMGYSKLGRVEIGDGVFVGARAIVLPGVSIGPGATIAAGAVVRDDVEAGTLVAGSPARPVMPTHDYIARQTERMTGRPVYDRTWTVSGGIDHARREEMRAALSDGPGFVK